MPPAADYTYALSPRAFETTSERDKERKEESGFSALGLGTALTNWFRTGGGSGAGAGAGSGAGADAGTGAGSSNGTGSGSDSGRSSFAEERQLSDQRDPRDSSDPRDPREPRDQRDQRDPLYGSLSALGGAPDAEYADQLTYSVDDLENERPLVLMPPAALGGAATRAAKSSSATGSATGSGAGSGAGTGAGAGGLATASSARRQSYAATLKDLRATRAPLPSSAAGVKAATIPGATSSSANANASTSANASASAGAGSSGREGPGSNTYANANTNTNTGHVAAAVTAVKAKMQLSGGKR